MLMDNEALFSTGRHNLDIGWACGVFSTGTSRGVHVSSASCKLPRTSASGRITGARRLDLRIVVERLRRQSSVYFFLPIVVERLGRRFCVCRTRSTLLSTNRALVVGTCGELPLVTLHPATSQISRCSSFDTAPALAVVCIFQLPLCALHRLVEYLFASRPALEYISPAPLMNFFSLQCRRCMLLLRLWCSTCSPAPAVSAQLDTRVVTFNVPIRHEAIQAETLNVLTRHVQAERVSRSSCLRPSTRGSKRTRRAWKEGAFSDRNVFCLSSATQEFSLF